MAEALEQRVLTGAPGYVNLRTVVENVVQAAVARLHTLSQLLTVRSSQER